MTEKPTHEELKQRVKQLEKRIADRKHPAAMQPISFMDAIVKCQAQYIQGSDRHQVFKSLLSALLEYTNSEHGFIGEVYYEDDGTSYQLSRAISDLSWDEDSREYYERNWRDGLRFESNDTLFGLVSRSGQVVISNDPANDPKHNGVPAGHPEIRSFVGIPIYHKDRLVGSLGLANRSGGYDSDLVYELRPLVSTCSVIISALKVDQERKQAEESLREGEQVMRYIVKHDPNAIAVYDRNLRYIAVSDRYIQDYNVAEKNILGKHHYEVFPEMPQRWKDVHQRVLEGATERHDDDQFERPDGSITRNRWECRPWYTANGSIGGMITYTEVTTERKIAEQALIQSRSLLRTLVDTIPDLVWLKDPEGVYLSCNPTFERFFGAKESEIIGKTDYDFIDKDLADFFREHDRKAVEADHPSVNREWLTFADNGYHGLFETIKTPMRDSNGSLVGVLGVARDITQLERNLEVIRDSEQRFRELFDNMSAGVAIYTSPDDGQSFVFKDLNRAGLEQGQKRKNEIIGRDVRNVFPGVEALGLFEVFKRVWKTGSPEHHPSSTYKDDKLVLWVENYVCKLPSGELVAIYEDTTARKQAEQAKERLEKQLIQSQRLESVGNLAGGIAHDFNNILSSIIGYTELVLDDVDPNTTIENNLQEVYAAGKRARDLVKQILAFARQSDEEIKPVQISVIAKEVLKFIRSTIPTSIEIKQDIESNSMIMGNATQVHQILMNLCTNAAHAMENEGGTLEMSLKDVVLDSRKMANTMRINPGDYIEIKVSDTGVGISPDILGSIFEPYFTTKGPGEGTGMGLATVHGIVEAYGGKITVDSTFGKGTTFTVYLPITRNRKEPRPYETGILPFGKERILFVDDESSIARMGGQILSSLGYSVSTRTSGIEALELFRTRPNDFDLVITDMTMPNITGDKLAIELMAIRPDIPIILCTGYSKKISGETASEIGIKAFAYKPVVKAELAKTVRKVLNEAQKKS